MIVRRQGDIENSTSWSGSSWSIVPSGRCGSNKLAYTLFKTLGLKELELHINSIGDYKCRPIYRQKLIEFFEEKEDQLCDDCQARLHKNPLRILDCKEDSCRRASAGAPKITDYLCDECEKKFEAVKRYLAALEIPYSVDSRLVRGLDYYTNTAFEIQYPPLGAQSAIMWRWSL